METARSVPFLDTRVVRSEDNIIKLDWYQKPSSSGRYLHFRSHHNVDMKLNIINQFKNRIVNIVHEDYCRGSLARLEVILLDNGYPKTLVKKYLCNTVTRPPSLTSTDLNMDPNTDTPAPLARYRSLPYFTSLTAKLCHIFSEIDDLKVAKYNFITGKMIFTRLKDRIPPSSTSDCIYSVPCFDCEGVYIGQTSQTIKRRITLHKSDVKLRPDRCALALHSSQQGHRFDFDSVEILDVAANYHKRVFLEMVHINSNPNSINKKTDVSRLSCIYSYLLSHHFK
ncbi:hypothetical protein WA026_012701 [Henosepilachna vigintioctopunctata]